MLTTLTPQRVSRGVKMLLKGEFDHLQRAFWRMGSEYFAQKTEIKPALPRPTDEFDLKLQSFVDRTRNGSAKAEKNLWWQHLYKKPVYNLRGTEIPSLEDVYSPLYDLEFVNNHLHEQFQKGAEHHDEYFELHGHYHALIDSAFKFIGLEKRELNYKVLDVGSGTGNSIFPLLKLLPNAKVLASELSLQMLVQLRKRLQRTGLEDRCGLMQLNAEELDFKPEAFDLVVGAAILHHMFQPGRTLEGAAKCLKPGGYAIFFEPFSNGNMMLHLMMHLILEQDFKQSQKISPALRKYLHGFIDGMNQVWGVDKSDRRFLGIDDKWAFPKYFFLELAAAHFSECHFQSLHDSERPFYGQLRIILIKYGGVPEQEIPSWVWNIADEYDRNLSPEQKADLMIEGCVILKK